MIIRGDKIWLRGIEPEDNTVLLDMINDRETELLTGGWSFPVSEREQAEWFQNRKKDEHLLRCMIAQQDNSPVGTIILSDIDYKNGTGQVHIKIHKKFCGDGYGLDALQSITRYAFFELRMHCLYACINEYNFVSAKLFEKAGFLKEAELRKRIYKSGEYHSVLIYSILSEEFKI